ncbi:hypothetical protein C0J52_00667 [Blattella germanica]|nr:hypothetical protein C0J52_00667 [Blattella germanica]
MKRDSRYIPKNSFSNRPKSPSCDRLEVVRSEQACRRSLQIACMLSLISNYRDAILISISKRRVP